MKLIKKCFFYRQFYLIVIGIAIFLMNCSFAFSASSSLKINLDKCIQTALENNLGFKIAASAVDVTEVQIDEAKASKKLNIKLQGGYLQMSETLDEEDMQAGDFSDLFSLGQGAPIISVKANQILYSGGKLTSYIEQAEANKQIALNDLESEQQEVIFRTTEAYYQGLKAEGIKKVSAQAVKQMQAHLEDSEALLKEGMIAPIDLNLIKSQLSNLEHNLIKAENGFELAKFNLNSIMGIGLNTELILENNLSYEPCEIKLEEALLLALKNRPETKNLSQQRTIMQGLLDVAKSNKKPQVVLNAESGITGWQAAIVAEYSLFDGGANKAKIKEAEINLEQMDQNEKQVKQYIEFEVRSAFLNMQEAEKLIMVTEEGIENSRESFRIAQIKYNEGITTNAEVIDAQSTLIEAETNQLNALYNYNTARAALVKAMGNCE